jgi:hypothetical protein
MKLELSWAQKALLIWCVSFLILAEIVKMIGIEGRAATKIGLIEVLIAMLTGAAFGIAASAKKD